MERFKGVWNRWRRGKEVDDGSGGKRKVGEEWKSGVQSDFRDERGELDVEVMRKTLWEKIW